VLLKESHMTKYKARYIYNMVHPGTEFQWGVCLMDLVEWCTRTILAYFDSNGPDPVEVY
jgi:hypothetical protein